MAGIFCSVITTFAETTNPLAAAPRKNVYRLSLSSMLFLVRTPLIVLKLVDWHWLTRTSGKCSKYPALAWDHFILPDSLLLLLASVNNASLLAATFRDTLNRRGILKYTNTRWQFDDRLPSKNIWCFGMLLKTHFCIGKKKFCARCCWCTFSQYSYAK